MKRFIKYGVLPVVTFLFLLIATIIALPVVINVQKFLPEIETRLSSFTGRTVSIGSDFAVTFFPHLSISFSNLKIANPDGYLSDGFVKIESFEAKVKLLPLLRKEVEISRFIIGGLEVHLEKKSDGGVNWEFIKEKKGGDIIASSVSPWANWSMPGGLSIILFAITDGTIVWNDRVEHSDYRVDDLMFLINNFTLNNPVAMEFKASLGGTTLTAEGDFGPLGQNPGINPLAVDLAVSLVNSFSGRVKGKFFNLLDNPNYDLKIDIPPFSARELFTSLNIEFPYVTADPTTYRLVGIDITARGDKENVLIENSKIRVDDTFLGFSLAVKKFNDPDMDLTLNIDRLDLDRYLPSIVEEEQDEKKLGQKEQDPQIGGVWRQIKMTSALQVKELTVGGGIINDIQGNMHYADEILTVDSSSFGLCQGNAQATLTVDLKNENPQTSIDLKAQSVQGRPLLHDFVAKDFLSGSIDTDTHIQFSGNSRDAARKSLVADGIFTIRDGTVEGMDMVNALNNIVDLSPASDFSHRQIRTDFSELKSIFTIRNGLVDSRETILISPVARVLISGTADLVSTELKLMVKPIVLTVNTELQGDGKENLIGSVPFAISGTFAQPQIDIDGQYLSLDNLILSDEGDMQNLVDQKMPSPVDEDVKDLVGTTLIDPAVVAQRFGLQPELIRKDQAKKQLTIGTGRVRVSPLQEEDTRH